MIRVVLVVNGQTFISIKTYPDFEAADADAEKIDRGEQISREVAVFVDHDTRYC